MPAITHGTAETVVVGAGIAGLWTALSLAPHPVTVLSAGAIGAGSSSWAQGGMAAAVGINDSAALHLKDTLTAGAGLTQPEVARIICEGGPAAVASLAEAGVPFDRDANGDLRLGREAAHGRDRIVHVGGDEAGAAIMAALTERAQQAEHITLLERHVGEEILTDEDGVTGLALWDVTEQRLRVIRTGNIVLATGGIGGLYAVTTNPLMSQGHGVALAARAGATMQDLEFVQFHPTALDIGRDPAPLATEAIRGAGGLLRDAEGHRFMPDLHDDAELAPRDVVARGVAAAIGRTGGAFLDVRGELGARFSDAFPTVAAACADVGLDPEEDLLPIAPACHYHMGGVRTDSEGRADVAGLFAVGECACTGLHGANRLASNSLLEAIVMGERTAGAIAAESRRAGHPDGPGTGDIDHRPATDLGDLREGMGRHAGILREAGGLAALRAIQVKLSQNDGLSVGARLALVAASGVAASALARDESRGAHARTDHPQADDMARHSLARLEDGQWTVSFEGTPS